MKKLLLIMLSMIILTSCSVFDNKSNTQQAENFQLSSVNDAYEGIDELEGSDFGNIKMPDHITQTEVNELYKFSVINRKDADNNEAERVFKAFFGDKYDEKRYIGKRDENDVYYFYGEETGDFGQYYNGNASLKTADFTNGFQLSNIKHVYHIGSDDNESIELSGDKLTVSQLGSSALERLTLIFSDAFSPFTIAPKDIFEYEDTSGDNCVQMICALEYNGLMLEEYVSPHTENSTRQKDGADIMTFYQFNSIQLDLKKNNEYMFLLSSMPKTVTESKKITELISLKTATELLKKELSSNSRYEFDDVRLMYCSKVTKPIYSMDMENGEEILKELDNMSDEYVPTWCFICNDELSGYSRWSVKVNALTGEITIDAPDGAAGVIFNE